MPEFQAVFLSASQEESPEQQSLCTSRLDVTMVDDQMEDYTDEEPDDPYESTSCSSMSSITSSYLSDAMDDDDDNDDEEEDEQPWRLRLPIHGTIALRRALGRGEDPYDVEREQFVRKCSEVAGRWGPFRDVAVSFREVSYGAHQPYTEAARIIDGEAVSPGSFPTLEQMSVEEFDDTFRNVDRRVGRVS